MKARNGSQRVRAMGRPASKPTGRARREAKRREATSTSESVWPAAQRVLVGGVNSPVRAFRRVEQPPVIARAGQGPWLIEESGARLVDLIMGWGALVLGHRDEAVMRAVRAQLDRATVLGLTSRVEVELAELIVEALPSVDQVRFMPSGTEACMTAVRLARGATGRAKVLSFEGCYHGHSDGLLVKRGSGLATLGLAGSAGVLPAAAAETIVVPYNNEAALDAAFAQHGRELAAVILEPIAANMGVVAPPVSYLQRVRQLANEHGALVIFDEVVTGFRVAYGGAQTRLGVSPDLTVLGKIIGGGFPIGAVGGRRDLMRHLAPEGDVYHAGTFAGHPVSMVAGAATLRELKRRQPYESLERLGLQLADGLRERAKAAGVAVQLNAFASMLTLFFADRPVVDFATTQTASRARFAAFSTSLREQGILLPPSPFEAMFLSTAHTGRLIDQILSASESAYARCASTNP